MNTQIFFIRNYSVCTAAQSPGFVSCSTVAAMAAILNIWILFILKFVTAWLLSMLYVHTDVVTYCWKIKKCEISVAIASYAAEFVRSYEYCSCIERVELFFGFAVMVFVFARSVFTSDSYLHLNKGTCRPSYLPCPLFIPVPHVPWKSVPKTTRNQLKRHKSSQ